MWSQVGLRKHHYKAGRGDGIPVELFQILKDAAMKVLHSICQQIWKTQQWSVFIPIPKNAHVNVHVWTVNSQMFKLVLEKAEEPEIKLPTSTGSSKKQESPRKTSISALLTMPKPLTMWITINCGKFWKRREYQTTWPASWEICMQVRKQQLELDIEQQTASK